MDYGRFDYVAQPGDGAHLIPIIGPYDRFAIMWGYRPIPGASTPEAEKDSLDAWARRQDTDPMLRFGPYDRADPRAQTEDLGDDPVAATRLGLANLRRVAGFLLKGTERKGENYDDLQDMYGQLVRQWETELEHVVAVVGGVYGQRKHYGQEGVAHTPVPASRQEAAVAFLLAHAFQRPAFLLDPDVLRRFEASGSVQRIETVQSGLLDDLLEDDRIGRLAEAAALSGGSGDVYAPGDFLDQLRAGLFSELGEGDVRVGPFRRSLQRFWVEALSRKLKADSDLAALARGELEATADRIDARIDRAADRITRLHLEDLRERIRRALHPDGGGTG